MPGVDWELEIRKRYTSSLFTETHEFPTTLSISHRLLPICYESGLALGHTNDCAEYMNTATETYIKEALSNIFQQISSNGTGYIRTADYKRRVDREEEKVLQGELLRVGGGELPVEAEERRKRPPLCMEDLRLALLLGDGFLGQVPLISGAISNSHFLDAPGVEEIYDTSPPRKPLSNGLPNGINGTNPHALNNGWNDDLDDAMGSDDEFAWQGGSVKDMQDMDAALDAVLDQAHL
jgi:transcriptional coactivator HFI1/ADA1